MNDLSLHVLDITQNSISAGATLIKLIVNEDPDRDLMTIVIEDNGKGMSEDFLRKVTDPFATTRTTRKVGMGLPLFQQSARQSGGDMIVWSEVGEGTKVEATFGYSNIDRPPLGDIANVLIILVSSNPGIEFWFKYMYRGEEYIFDTVEIKEVLDGLPVSNPSVIIYLTDMVRENIIETKNTGNQKK